MSLPLESFRALQEDGLGLVDVGARDGVHPLFEEVASCIHLVGFEPDQEECDRLNASAQRSRWRKATYLPYGLGAEDGEATFHLCRSPGTSSFYRPNLAWLGRFPHPERYEVRGTRSVPVRSLDGLRADARCGLPESIDFLKIDTQGSELDVLQGARETLRRHAVGVEVEVSFSPIYESQPPFREVDRLLAELGFTLFKLRRKSWVRRICLGRPQVSAGQMVAADVLYFKDPWPVPEGGESLWTPHQLEALVLLSSLYDLNDFALEVVSHPRLSSLLDAAGIQRFIGLRAGGLDYSVDGTGRLGPGSKLFKELLKGKAGLGNLYEWTRRRRWGRADSDKDFYTRTAP